MPPKPRAPASANLFVSLLDELINLKHPLVRLAGLIDWSEIEHTFSVSFTSTRGRPAWWPAYCTCNTPSKPPKIELFRAD